jgi:uncharacterized Zn finger protein
MAWGNYYGFQPYVPVAERRRKAQREVAKLAKKGGTIRPIAIAGRTIARTFWGKAWCDNLEAYSDYSNRLPRGRTYVRNGSVVHLEVGSGEIQALVSGSELYRIKIRIHPTAPAKWQQLCQECAGGIGSLVELLQARLSDRVMGILTRPSTGLFPAPSEIKMACSCPDSAALCKHLAAVLYGVGARLDENPEMLFLLRSVDYEELIQQATNAKGLAGKAAAGPEIAETDLADVFGLELAHSPVATGTAASKVPAASPVAKATSPRSVQPARAQPAAGRRTAKRKPKPGRSPQRLAARKPTKVGAVAGSKRSPTV